MERLPLDRTLYPRHPDSRPIETGIEDGEYVFVRDVAGIVHVLTDGPHRHPLVLGGARPAMYAGDLRIANGDVVEITNLSGTFQFDEPNGLLDVVEVLENLHFIVTQDAVRFFPVDGSRPYVLR